MNSIKYVLLKGNENFLDHPKSVALYGKLFWRKSDKKLNVGDIVYLFMSGKGHYQIRAQGGLSVAGGCRCLTKELDMIAC